jgi:predicted Zn-dependent protease
MRRYARWPKALLLIAALAVPAEAVLAQAPSPVAAETIDDALYRPLDGDERGLWQTMEEQERSLRTSPSVLRDPALNAYVRGVLCRTTGAAKCRNVRLYLMHTAHFNALMAPNGMLQVGSGLLLRTQNEAQLAAVLGHEYTHFEHRHTLRLWREVRSKTNAAAWFNILPFGGVVSLGILVTVFDFSREMEREADGGGLRLMADAGYDSREAAIVWQRLREEMDATAAARKTKSRKDRDRGILETHPPTAERLSYLTNEAKRLPGVPGANGSEAYRAAMAKFWPIFVDDQLKLNDFGASEFLLSSLAANGWTPDLCYARAELYRRRATAGDLEKAATFYGDGITSGGTLPELWRGRGLAQLKLGRTEPGKADLSEYLKRAPEAPDKAMIAMLAGGAV